MLIRGKITLVESVLIYLRFLNNIFSYYDSVKFKLFLFIPSSLMLIYFNGLYSLKSEGLLCFLKWLPPAGIRRSGGKKKS